MKLQKYNSTILDAADKFGQSREGMPSRSALSKLDLDQLGELASRLLNEKNLEVSKVRPFFWSLIETYVDRFDLYPFDINKAMFSHLELNNYPEDVVLKMVQQLESQFEKNHGRPLRENTPPQRRVGALDDEIKQLRDSLKYAAMVAENEE